MDKVRLLLAGYLVLTLSACHGMPGTKQEQEKDDKHFSEQTSEAPISKDVPAGPNDAEREHHGVLMHGHDVRGKEHTEHAPPIAVEEKPQEPKDPDEAMHESMHGQEGSSVHASDQEKSSGDLNGPPDREEMMHKLMHDNDDIHKHSWDAQKPDDVQSPPDREHLMHNLLMHGDLEHGEDHEAQQNAEKGEKSDEVLSPLKHGEHNDMNHESEHVSSDRIGPLDAEEQLHGVLMHGDKEQGHHHDHESDKTEQIPDGPKGPDYDSLHGLLMHGDTEPGHDHSHEDKNAEHEVFRDLAKIVELGLDEDILKIANLEELLKKDKAEYAEYLATNPKSEDAANMGSTFATVPDTILSDMESMKQRYLSKLVDDSEALEMEAAIVDQRYKEEPFTADDINSVTGLGTDVHEHEDRNVHEMELIGNTEPINMRHKMFKVLQDNKEKEKREAKGQK